VAGATLLLMSLTPSSSTTRDGCREATRCPKWSGLEPLLLRAAKACTWSALAERRLGAGPDGPVGARRAGTGHPGVVLARLGIGVAGRGVPELGEHPDPRIDPSPGPEP
jgi:hypothetical protein